MTQRTTTYEALALLSALHDLAVTNRPADLGVLAGRLGWGAGRVVRVLAHLDRRGLAQRASCRLTLRGLAVIVALAHEQNAACAA
jgi:hypothetical protein